MGQPILPRVDRVRVEELLKDLREYYETTGDRNLRKADCRLTPLKAFFTGRRASALNGADFTRYVQKRQDATVANGTINRELSMLGTALRLGAEKIGIGVRSCNTIFWKCRLPYGSTAAH